MRSDLSPSVFLIGADQIERWTVDHTVSAQIRGFQAIAIAEKLEAGQELEILNRGWPRPLPLIVLLRVNCYYDIHSASRNNVAGALSKK
jgi:hypothetical protein